MRSHSVIRHHVERNSVLHCDHTVSSTYRTNKFGSHIAEPTCYYFICSDNVIALVSFTGRALHERRRRGWFSRSWLNHWTTEHDTTVERGKLRAAVVRLSQIAGVVDPVYIVAICDYARKPGALRAKIFVH